jgi:hypothetical protein
MTTSCDNNMEIQDMESEGKARHGKAWYSIPYHTMKRKCIPYNGKEMVCIGNAYHTNAYHFYFNFQCIP